MDKNFSRECDIAITSGDIEKIDELINQLKNLEENTERSPLLTHIWYCISNLYSTKARIFCEDISNWRNQTFPVYTVQSTNYMRRAYREYFRNNNVGMCFEIQTNLANIYHRFCRDIEAISLWSFDYSKAINSDSMFVAPFNKARTLIVLYSYLGFPYNADYSMEAYRLIKELSNNKNSIFHNRIRQEIDTTSWVAELLQWGNRFKEKHMALKYVSEQIKFDCIKEKEYRDWCLQNTLFINPLNDITQETIAAKDTLEFPNYIVEVGEGPFLSVAFSDIKNRFCKARYLFYSGLHEKYPNWLEKDLYLTSSLDLVDFSTNTENIKMAFKLCFGILDSIVVLLDKYFETNYNGNIYFKPTCLQKIFQNIQNPYIDALFWLSCDLTDSSKLKDWQVPNPDAYILRILRNNLEHGWVRISETNLHIWKGKHDYAKSITKEELEVTTMEVFRYTRCAIMYLIFAVTYNEKFRNLDNHEMVANMEVPQYIP